MDRTSLNRHSTVLLFVALATVVFVLARESRRSLWVAEKIVDIKYRAPDIGYRELVQRLAAGAPHTLIFDTRAAAAYQTSHIRWALHVDARASAGQFLQACGGDIRGKRLVFYSAVGDRSSRMVQRIREPVLKAGALSVDNLKGGIIGWYNQGLTLYGPSGKTEALYTQDSRWRKLVKKRPG